MYLQAERYVSGYEFRPAEEQELYHRLVKSFDLEAIVPDHTPSATVSFTVAYWRKANSVHKWFVDNVQDGKDDCERYAVSRVKLAELRDLCAGLLRVKVKSPGVAVAAVLENLPPSEGFFFGSTEVDEWFWQDMQVTVAQLDRALELGGSFDFYYESSW